MKVIYIAGPYRAKHSWQIHQHIHRSWEMALNIWSHGHIPLSPHLIGMHMDGIASEEVFIEGTMELMRRCDAIVLLRGYEESSGSLGEIAEANRLGIPIFYGFSELTEWSSKQEELEGEREHVRQNGTGEEDTPGR